MLLFLLQFIHIVACILLVVVVLLQSSKGSELSGAFGGGGQAAIFGPTGAQSFLAKLTQVCAVTFMVTSLALGYIYLKKSKGVSVDLSDVPIQQQQTLPGQLPMQQDQGFPQQQGIPSQGEQQPMQGDLEAPIQGGAEQPLPINSAGEVGASQEGTGQQHNND